MTESRLVNSHAKIPNPSLHGDISAANGPILLQDIVWYAIFYSFYFYAIISASSYLHAKQQLFVQQLFFCNAIEPEVLRTEQRYVPLYFVLDVCHTKINRLDVFWPWASYSVSVNLKSAPGLA